MQTEMTDTTLITESQREYMIRSGKATPRFLQGVYPFIGRGIFEQDVVDESLHYTVPAGFTAEITYLRAGNLSTEMLYLVITANGSPLRYFPLGAGSSCHVELAIVERHLAGTRIDVAFAAPRALSGAIVLDIGILEIGEAK